jgi:capsular exopolysaccharide synthesis family protein
MGYVFDALTRAAGQDRPSNPAPAGAVISAPEKAEHEAPPAPFSLAELPTSCPTPPNDEEPPVELASSLRLRIASDESLPQGLDDRMVMLTEPSSLMAEEYRSIRTGLLARWRQKRHLVHTVTSATPQEGKTITSLNLGLSFAELRNRRTVVVEADLRLPQFAALMGIPPGSGLVNYLKGEAALDDVVHPLGQTGLSLIPAGGHVRNDAVQLLSSSEMSALLKTLRQNFDHVIVDTPPVVELADAGILGAQSDDVLMVVRMQRTPRHLVEQAIRTLNSYNAPVAGLIATDQKRSRSHYYSRYGYRENRRYYAKAA